MTYLPANTKNAFLSTSEVYPTEESQRIIKHQSTYANIATAINIREIAMYDLNEIVTGQVFFNPTSISKRRLAYRRVFSFGAIAAGTTLNIAHNITGLTMLTHMYGTVITNTVDYRPIPYVDPVVVTKGIGILLSGANIVITNGATAPNITSGIVVIEYLKN